MIFGATGLGGMKRRVRLRIEEFGLLQVFSAPNAQQAPPVLANSIPKAGTNLLMRALYVSKRFRRVPRRTLSEDHAYAARMIAKIPASTFWPAHLPHHPDLETSILQANIKNILMVRHPADIAISNVHYIMDRKNGHRLHSYFSEQLDDFDERLEAVIFGVPSKYLNQRRSPSLVEHIERYAGWAGSKNCHIVRYEEVVGSKGGGSDEAQFACLKDLYNFLDVTVDTQAISNKVHSEDSRTFRRGEAFGFRNAGLSPRSMASLAVLDHVAELLGYSG